jgi:hypothetical protein
MHRSMRFLAFSSLAAAALVLSPQITALAVQLQPVQPDISQTEVVPPGLVVGHSDPLAKLFGEDVAREGVRGIDALTTDIRIKDLRDGKPAGDIPPDEAGKVLSSQAQLAFGREQRPWTPLCYHWEASGLFSQPLYFQDWNLERYGYSPKGLRLLQPIVSAGRFYATVFTLPYQIVAHPPKEPVYSLGYYRPGSPAPYRWSRPEFHPAAGVAAMGFYAGLIFLIP